MTGMTKRGAYNSIIPSSSIILNKLIKQQQITGLVFTKEIIQRPTAKHKSSIWLLILNFYCFGVNFH